jgi:glycerol-3-phosphate dehydrogenase
VDHLPQKGQDTVEAIARLKGWKLPPSTSSTIKLHGYAHNGTTEEHLGIYGSDATGIRALIAQNPELGTTLHSRYPYTRAEVVWIVRNEMALKLEDVLCRRLRILMLDARAAVEMAPEVAGIMRRELNLSPEWEKTEVSTFQQLAQDYLITT